jgi:hypothetical protein
LAIELDGFVGYQTFLGIHSGFCVDHSNLLETRMEIAAY